MDKRFDLQTQWKPPIFTPVYPDKGNLINFLALNSERIKRYIEQLDPNQKEIITFMGTAAELLYGEQMQKALSEVK